MFTALVVIIHVLVALSLIMIILLQTGKGAGMGAAFGGSSSTVFGSTGRASFLTKVTIGAAVIFTLTSMGLSLMQSGPSGVMQDFQAPATTVPTIPQIPPTPGPEGDLTGTVVPVTPGAETGPGANVPGLPEENPGAVPEAPPAATGGEATRVAPAQEPVAPPPPSAPTAAPPTPGTPSPAPGQ